MPLRLREDDMFQSQISQHAKVRMQQRAIKPALVDFVRNNVDFVQSAGRGCQQLRVRRRNLDCDATPEVVEKASRLKIVENRNGEVVTVMWLRDRRVCRFGRAKHYARTWSFDAADDE
jgi:hypothetical protein